MIFFEYFLLSMLISSWMINTYILAWLRFKPKRKKKDIIINLYLDSKEEEPEKLSEEIDDGK